MADRERGSNACKGSQRVETPTGPAATAFPITDLTDDGVTVVRPLDLLWLRFRFHNLKVDTSRAKPQLIAKDPKRDSYLSVHFPPQSVAEQVFNRTDGPGNVEPDPPPVASRGADAEAARLVFRVLKLPVALTLEALLAWNDQVRFKLQTRVPLGGTFDVRKPTSVESTFELPYRLFLSPDPTSAWRHRLDPVLSGTTGDRIELWHSRLAERRLVGGKQIIDESDRANRKLHPVWTPDLESATPTNPFPMAMDPQQRKDIVKLSTGLADYRRPVRAERMVLSALGAWLRSQGLWDPLPTHGINTSAWRHDSTLGRDHFCRVVSKGYLFPFGHAAVLVEVTERLSQRPDPAKNASWFLGAYLRKWRFIVCTEEERDYDDPSNEMKHGGREMSFGRLRVLDTISPILDTTTGNSPQPTHPIDNKGWLAFWPYNNGRPVEFRIRGEDRADQAAETKARLIFVAQSLATDPSFLMQKVQPAYKQPVSAAGGTPLYANVMSGQKVAYAPDAKRGDTAFETELMFFDLLDSKIVKDRVLFNPRLEKAVIALATGKLVGQANAATVAYFKEYLDNAFDNVKNRGQVFLEALERVPIEFSAAGAAAEKAMSVVVPNLSTTGISRVLGPVSDLANIARGNLRPGDFFPDDARILGGIRLKDLLDNVISDVKSMPLFKQLHLDDPPPRIETTYEWSTDLRNFGNVFASRAGKQAKLKIVAKVVAYLDPAQPGRVTYDFQCTLTEFQISFLSLVDIEFAKLALTRQSGSSTKVDVDIAKVNFNGALDFVAKLSSLLGSGSLGRFPPVRLDGLRLVLEYALKLPDISIGAFSLQNILPIIGGELPLNNQPMKFRFGFGDRQRRFFLSILCFGGGGFVGLRLRPDSSVSPPVRIESIEAALEFGGELSLDVVVAKGRVYVVAGIYFSWEETPQKRLVVEGYLRAGGSLEILGLITVNVELYLGLRYERINNRPSLIGTASYTVSIDILFFSASVTVTYSRTFVGGESQRMFSTRDPLDALADAVSTPAFGDVVKEEKWNEYWHAFAS